MTLLGGERPSRRSLAVPIREISGGRRAARDEARTVVRASPPGRPHLEGDNEHSIPAERAECKWKGAVARHPLHVPPSYGQLHTRDVRPGAEAEGEATQRHGWFGGAAAIRSSVGATTRNDQL